MSEEIPNNDKPEGEMPETGESSQAEQPEQSEQVGQTGQPEQPEQTEKDNGSKTGMIIGIVALVGLIIVLILIMTGVFSGNEDESAVTPVAGATIEILAPVNGAVLNIDEPINVNGMGSGLPEGNVVVEALDQAGNVLAQQATIINAPNAGTGGAGPWVVELQVVTESGTPGSIRAYSTNPADGSVMAEAMVQVVFGEGSVQSFIQINEPVDGSEVDISAPIVVSGNAGGLHEGTLVVQIVDQNGNVLAEQPATINAPDAGTGGSGPWQVEIQVQQVQAEAGTTGTVRAFSKSPAGDDVVAEDQVQVVIGKQPPAVEAYIQIDTPTDGTVLDSTQPIQVSGMGAGLFEGNVVVQALDAQGNVLAEMATIIQSPDAGIGGEGSWNAELNVNMATETNGKIRAFSTSPKDGSVTAEASVAVVFFPGEAPPEEGVKLEEHLWLLISYNGQPLIDGTMIVAQFKDSKVTGTGGCNNYFSSYDSANGSIAIAEVGTNRMFCEKPEGVMEQEAAYLATLQQAATYQFENGQLTMYDANGNAILVFQAAVVGNVISQQATEIPEGSTVTVTLADVSQANAPEKMIGQQVIDNASTFPFPFAVTYEAEVIEQNLTYAVRVQITDSGGNLIYTSSTAYNVITGGNPSVVDIEVEPIQ